MESEDLVDGGGQRGQGLHECVMTLTCLADCLCDT